MQFVWLLLVLDYVALKCQAGMNAWVATSASTQGFQSLSIPTIGDLHRQYSDLPSSCEYLLEVMASSVNPSDVSPQIAQYPHVIGSDVAAIVVEVGPGCTKLQVGDQVWADIGANTRTVSGAKTKELGAYGEYVLGLESQLGRMPTNLGFLEAAALPKVALTSYKAFVWYCDALNDTRWSKKPSVLVLGGSGGTGSTGIQLAKAFGAVVVITTCSSKNTLYCKGLGADLVIDYATTNWWELLSSNSVDIVYDTVGQPGTGNYAMDKIRPGGFYVTITGALATKVKPGVTQNMFINSDTNLDNLKELNALKSLVESELLRMHHIDGIYTLPTIGQAFNVSRAGHVVGKLVISVGNNSAGYETEL